MSGRQFDKTESAELRAKIDKAKPLLPLPDLMRRLRYDEKHMGKTALCPFHSDERPSFSVWHGKNGWQHKCHVGCSSGDEIAFLVKHFECSRREAIRRYLDMAGFPARVPRTSHEYPKSREYPASHECPEYPVFPVSGGQGLHGKLEQALKALAVRNACTGHNTARSKRFKLARDVAAVEKGIGRELNIGELTPVFDEWYGLSQQFLDAANTRDDQLAAFFAELGKVRFPTGEGDTLNKALHATAKLRTSELQMIPGMPEASEIWRRVATLHREMSRLCDGKKYFLGCRHTAKAAPGLSYQTAYNMNLGLAQLGVIRIVQKGKAGEKSRKAAVFQYLLPRTQDCPF